MRHKHIQRLCCSKGIYDCWRKRTPSAKLHSNAWQDGRRDDDKVSEALSGRYFFEPVRVGTGATNRELRNVEANHSGPLRVLRDERWEAFQQRHHRYE